MSNFSKNDSLLINGSLVVISEFLSGGNQGEVYKAINAKKSEYQALKFLFGNYASPKDKKKFYDRTVLITRTTPSHPAFAWPCGIGKFDDSTKCFSYTMPLKVGFSSSALLIRYPESFTMDMKITVAMKTLEAFCTLEEAGLIYTDVSEKNILFKITPDNEIEVAIIDCENITLNFLSLGLEGTGYFRAPEVLLGAPPDASSVVHALSVWVYRLLVAGVHPLNGSNQQGILLDDAAVVEHFGKNPQFVFGNGSNRPYPTAVEAWNKLPPLMQHYFSYTFSDEVLKGKNSRMNIRYMYNCLKKAYNL